VPNIGGAARAVAFHTWQDDTYTLNDHRPTTPRRRKRNNPRLPISLATRKTPEVPLILPLANTRREKKLTSSTTEKLRKPAAETSTPSPPSLEKRRSTQKTSTPHLWRAPARPPQKQQRTKSNDECLADTVAKT
jgi:hypothetical protein